eukprot:CAMPEP_0172833404 /NCGR_PEP_ID=MMETSP1075-20121228/24341_1 /TAXON_ID=2916 /ORGANISM="Ceratium fusus, Strain PA161109" /LENGTH=37 /DNA_ID= /DNA_START= /DNA_END= /DNA_ORIENTATION=
MSSSDAQSNEGRELIIPPVMTRRSLQKRRTLTTLTAR